MSLTNIIETHKKAFEALNSGDPNFALISCFFNGEPTAAIAYVKEGEQNNEFEIFPLFIAVTDKMKLTDHDGVEAK